MKFTQNQWFYCDILKFQTSKGKKRNQICKSIAYSVYFPTHKCSGSDIFQQKKEDFFACNCVEIVFCVLPHNNFNMQNNIQTSKTLLIGNLASEWNENRQKNSGSIYTSGSNRR